MVIRYESGGELNESLAKLGRALGNYNNQTSQFNPFETKKLAGQLGLSSDEINDLDMNDWAKISNYANSNSSSLSRSDALRSAINQVRSESKPQEQNNPESFLQSFLGAFRSPEQATEREQTPFENMINSMDQKREETKDLSVLKKFQLATKEKGQAGVDEERGTLSSLLFPFMGDDPKDSFDPLIKGINSTIVGQSISAMGGEGEKAFRERTGLKKDNFTNRLLFNIAKIGLDLPAYAVGGTLGGAAGSSFGPVGTTTGTASGAMAFPAMIESGLQEYREHLDRGGKGSFGDFINSFNKVARDTIEGGAKGIILGGLQKLQLNKIPGLKGLEKIKGAAAVNKILDTGAQAGIFTTIEAGSQGRFPSVNEYADNIALFLGLDVLNNSGKYKNSVYKALKESNLQPEQAAKMIKERAEVKNYDLNNPNDIVRVVKDITNEASKSKDVFKEKVNLPDKEALGISETSKRIAERPIDKYLDKKEKSDADKAKPLTTQEQVKRELSREDADSIKKKIQELDQKIETAQERIEVPGLRSTLRKFNEEGKAKFESERTELQRKLEDATDIAEKGKKRFRKEETQVEARERVERLFEDVLNPESDSAKKTEKDFARDQKYVNDYFKLVEKGEIPPAKFKDQYIKKLETYLDEYTKELDNVNTQLKNPPRGKKKNLEAYKNLIERNMTINKSKIALQKDKNSALNQLQGPKGALVKQNLKELRKDIESLQKDFVKVSKVKDSLEAKTQEAALKSLEIKSNQDKLMRNLEKGNLNQVSMDTGLPVSKIKELKESAKEFVDDVFKSGKKEKAKGEEGTPTLAKRLNARYQNAPILVRKVLGAAILYPLVKSINDITGLKLSNRDLSILLGSTMFGKMGFAGGGSILILANKVSKAKVIIDYTNELQNAKDKNERADIFKKMRKEGVKSSQIKLIKSKVRP